MRSVIWSCPIWTADPDNLGAVVKRGYGLNLKPFTPEGDAFFADASDEFSRLDDFG